MILSCQKIHLAYATDVILEDVNMQLNAGERVAIVGVNGAGKSTLLKIITGELPQTSGDVTRGTGTSMGYLSQSAFLNSEEPLYDILLHSNEEILNVESRLRDLEDQISHNQVSLDDLTTLTHQYDALLHTYQQLDGYSYRSLVKGVLNGLGFYEEDFMRPISTLSGGQKTRLALGQLLIKSPDILLLDEPTNHLDIQATRWLEGFLSSYRGTLLVVSHDRYFLDQVTNRTLEIERGFSKMYSGNYSFFVQNKAAQLQVTEKHFANQQKEIKKQQEIIRELRSFGNEKFIKRAQSREKALDKVELIDKPMSLNDTMHIKLAPKIESGNDVLFIEDLSHSFGTLSLFNQVQMAIRKGERVALIGANGTGKSTLFKLLTGLLPVQSGSFRYGTNVHVSYYDQEHQTLSSQKSLMAEIQDAYPLMGNTQVRNTLAAFLFTGDDVFKPIETLSGGEKGRLTLCKLMLSNGNFLLLDEPTNHLDMVSKEVLENVLRNYTGTLLFISHDRYFINQVATKIIELEDNRFTEYIGNYDDYTEKKKSLQKETEILQSQSQSSNDTQVSGNKLIKGLTPAASQTTDASSNKDSWLKQKELETQRRKVKSTFQKVEDRLHAVEARIQEIDQQLCLEEVYTSYVQTQKYNDEKSELNTELEGLYDQWSELDAEINALFD